MALINLYHVTESLVNLLDWNIKQNLEAGLSSLSITSLPPNVTADDGLALSVYLYHVAEDPHYKNQVLPGRGSAAVATTPMALSLYYVITVRNPALDDDNMANNSPQLQQQIMGLVLKTMHDHPVITDRLMRNDGIDEVPVLHPDIWGRDNQLQIILRPLAPEDCVNFWSADDTGLARLSAFYEVRVVMLRPEAPKRQAAPVLSVGTFVQQLGVTELRCTRNHIRFAHPPGLVSDTGGVQELQSSPARVVHGAPPFVPAPAPEARVGRGFELLGSNLAQGLGRRLRLAGPLLRARGTGFERLEGKLILDEGSLAPSHQAQGPIFRPGSVDLDLTDEVAGRVGAGDSSSYIVAPGSYGLSLETIQQRQRIGGSVKELSSTSNDVPLTVAGRLTEVSLVDTSGNPGQELLRLRVELPQPSGGPSLYLDSELFVDAPAVAPEGELFELQLVAAGTVFTRRSSVGPADLELGEFAIERDGADSLIFCRPAFLDPVQSGLHALQLTINGVASYPLWIEVSA